MKKTAEIIPQLKSYFGAMTIGSYLLVEEGYLDSNDVNDIDIVVTTKQDRVESFLEDLGFSATESEDAKSSRFKSDLYDKPIDIYRSLINHPTTVDNVIRHKFNRGYKDDLDQLELVIKRRKEKLQ